MKKYLCLATCLLALSGCATNRYIGVEIRKDNPNICKITALPQQCHYSNENVNIDFSIEQVESTGDYQITGLIAVGSRGRNLEITGGNVKTLLFEQTPGSYRVYDSTGTNMFGNTKNQLKFNKTVTVAKQPEGLAIVASLKGKSY